MVWGFAKRRFEDSLEKQEVSLMKRKGLISLGMAAFYGTLRRGWRWESITRLCAGRAGKRIKATLDRSKGQATDEGIAGLVIVAS